ncbi:hypothetical protein LINGRAHAP2_LOCUS21245 [Linum grandiflorum]
MPPAAAQPHKPPDPVSGVRRPAQTSSSPNSKSDKASHPAAKKVRAMTFTKPIGTEESIVQEVEVEDVLVEDVTYEDDLMKDPVENNKQSKAPPVPNAWTNDAAKLFDRSEEWYVADSDSEDVAESMREEDDMMDEDDDPTCPSILFTVAEKLSFRREWRSALVVKGLGRRIPYLPLARRLNFLWAKTGNIQISDLNNGYFLVRFREKEDYEATMIGGPWMLGETYLTAVMRIASKIGTPVRVDRATKEGARAKYARVCVEVDLTRPLLSKYRIEGVRYFIGYEGLKDLCTNCGKYGAPALRCTCRNPVPDEDPMMDSAVNEEQSREEETEKVYGSWMVPRSRKKGGTGVTIYNNRVIRKDNPIMQPNILLWFQILSLFCRKQTQLLSQRRMFGHPCHRPALTIGLRHPPISELCHPGPHSNHLDLP